MNCQTWLGVAWLFVVRVILVKMVYLCNHEKTKVNLKKAMRVLVNLPLVKIE